MGTMAEESQGVRSIRRALDILSLLTDDTPSVSVRDIVEATGLPKTTVLRLVQTLEHSGLLWATAGGYMAGPGLWRWAYLARRSWQLPPETQAMMRELGARHGETVNLYVLRDISRVCVAQQESPRPLRHVVARRRRAAAVGGRVVQGAAARRAGVPARPHRAQLARTARATSRPCGSGSPRPGGTGTRSATASARRACPRWPCRSPAGPAPSWPRSRSAAPPCGSPRSG